MGWEPIDTAPKDGNPFLACDWQTKDSCEVVFYEPTHEGSDFVWAQTEHDCTMHKTRFTHWMPLPNMPTGP